MQFVGAIPSALIINGIPVCHTDRREYPQKQQIDARHCQILMPWASRVNDIVQILLPAFTYDGFSVPRLFWSFQSPFTGLGAAGAADHDGWYWSRWLDEQGSRAARLLADDRFWLIMRHYGETAARAWIMHRAVRDVSWMAWMKYGREAEANRNQGLVKLFHINQAQEIIDTLAA